ncbi:AMP-binding protein [Synechococcus sp. PCC 7336]|uniref:AMP-binding protein n=1 Tax=Synechococcus sp. PCC 7336 TaxID=195250 RepID=UPI0003464A14|nr:AMP-binding protein [Synechococcus sp. PCC 7336]
MAGPGKLAGDEKRCIYDLVAFQARSNPEAIAIAAPGHTPLSYRELLEQIHCIADKLNAIGVGRNDRVAIVLPNGPEMAVAFLAIASSATCAPLNPAYRQSEYDFYLSDLDAKALIVRSGIAVPAVEVARKKGIPLLELSPVKQAAAGIFQLLGGEPQHPDRGGIAQPEDVALVLHTSGTTSRPKMVPLTGHNLCSSANNIAATLRLGAGDRCLNVMPLFHIHGLVGSLLSSLNAGASLVCTPGFDAIQFFDWLAEFRPTWYSAVPTMHQAILARAVDCRDIIAQCPLRFIRASSAPLPPQVMAALEAVLNAPAIESYGMTEASHQMTSNPLPPQARKPGSVGVAAGPEVAIADEAGQLLPVGEVGEIVIRGANVTSGYYNNPDANHSAFTEGWFRTGDLGYFDRDRYLFLQGRIKEMINRGGEKIAPRDIDEVLLSHPDVAQAVAFAMPHPQLGEDIAAAVVLQPKSSATSAAIRAYLFQQLADFKVPSQVAIVDDIPKGATGKLQRLGLADKLADVLVAQSVAPRNPLEKIIAATIQEVLDLETLSIHDNFFAIGGDSLRGTQVVNRLRALFGIELPHTILFRHLTVAELAEELAALTPSSEDMAAVAEVLLELAKLPPETITQLMNEL